VTKIEAHDVYKEFNVINEAGKHEKLVVLDNFDLEVKQGEFLAILGPSGCGKSSFLNILAGLDRQNSGDILIDKQSVLDNKFDRGVVFQGYALYPWRTVLENVAIGLEIRGVGRQEREQIAYEYLSLVGLKQFAKRRPHQLSGGMKQRVAIARALVYQPEILLMDEPFAALDAQTRELLQFELLRIWEADKKTIIFVTHSIDEAILMADRVAVMTARPGKIKEIIDISLPRPRTGEIRNSPEFIQIRQKAWNLIKDEVIRAQNLEDDDNTDKGSFKKQGDEQSHEKVS